MKRGKIGAVFVVLVIILGTFSAGCIGRHTISSSTVQSVSHPTSTSVSSSKSSSTVQFVVVKDCMNRTVKIKEPVKKVISLYGLAPQFLYLLGAGKQFYGGWMWGTKFYELLDPKVNEKASMRDLGVEQIEKIKPNFVIAAYWQADESKVKQLESLGVPVVMIKVESPSDIYQTVETLGKALRKDRVASRIIAYYKNASRYVKEKLKGVKNRPTVLVLYYSGRAKAFRTFGGDMFQSRLIEMAGGISVSANLTGKKTIDVEQVAKWNPDVIILIGYGVSGEQAKKMLLSDSAWKAVSAVKEGRLYVVPNDGDNWIDPSPKWVLGLYWLAKLLHPGLFKNLNVERKAARFYEEFFNLSPSKVKLTGDLNATLSQG